MRNLLGSFATTCFLLLVVFAEPALAADRPKNVLLILADDLGYECLGADGGTSYRTPNLDKLASQGARFEHCYVQPLCTPTRAQLMTGQYNVRNYERFGVLDRGQQTFGNIFHDAGYATCVVGKWQLDRGLDSPGHFGFDDYCLWHLSRRHLRYKNPGLDIDGREVDYSQGEYGPDIVSDHGCEFLSNVGQKPFFLYYPMMLVHDPYCPTPDSEDYDSYVPTNSKPTLTHFSEKGRRNFGEMVEYMDKIVGKLLAKLESEGLRDSTLVIFLGDNGTGRGTPTMMGERLVVGGKASADDSGMHVPLIVAGPGVKPCTVVRDLVDSTDFLPTLCEATGVTLPTDRPMDGRSFWAQCRGEAGNPREAIYCWYSPDGRSPPLAEFVRSHDIKLHRDGRLFDVRQGDDGQRPLDPAALDASQKAEVASLQAMLDRYRDVRPAKFQKSRGSATATASGE